MLMRSTSTKQAIREAIGGTQGTLREFVVICDAFDIWDDVQEDEAVVLWKIRQIKDALREKDSRGLPYAAPVTEDDQWLPLSLFCEADYRFVVASREAALFDDYAVLLALAEDCKERLGVSISIPKLDKQQRFDPNA